MTTTRSRGRRHRFARPNLPAMDAAAAGPAFGSGGHVSPARCRGRTKVPRISRELAQARERAWMAMASSNSAQRDYRFSDFLSGFVRFATLARAGRTVVCCGWIGQRTRDSRNVCSLSGFIRFKGLRTAARGRGWRRPGLAASEKQLENVSCFIRCSTCRADERPLFTVVRTNGVRRKQSFVKGAWLPAKARGLP